MKEVIYVKIEIINQNKLTCVLTMEETKKYELTLETLENPTETQMQLVKDITKFIKWENKLMEEYYIQMDIVFMEERDETLITMEFMSKEDFSSSCTSNNINQEDICNIHDYNTFDEIFFDTEQENDEEKSELDNALLDMNNKYEQIKLYQHTYCFDKLDKVINAANFIIDNFIGDSSLYKDETNNKFYLVINYIMKLGDAATIHFKINEFTNEETKLKESYLIEHHKLMIQSNAIERLIWF